MKKTFLLIGLMLALALAACSPSAAVDVEGTEWGLVEMYGSPPLASTNLTMRFEKNNISGSAGCNNYGSSYVLQRDGSLIAGPMESTLMACLDDGVMDQEQAFLELLGSGVKLEVQADHLLLMDANGAVQAVFVRISPK